MRRAWLLALAVALVVSACSGLSLGREFPSPDAAQIKVNVTDKAALLVLLGEPYQVGIDSGDQTWRWFYGQRNADAELSKDFAVRFNADGTVKSYSFSSNFPDDMKLFK